MLQVAQGIVWFCACSALGGLREKVAAPVAYGDVMLIVKTSEGVAAVVFTGVSSRDSLVKGDESTVEVRYQYRFLDRKTKREALGEGRVFDKSRRLWIAPLHAQVIDLGNDVFIRAGPIKLQWSHGNNARGWIYYAPERMSVEIGAKGDFRRMDLARFLRGVR
jgi:hypothetical protein